MKPLFTNGNDDDTEHNDEEEDEMPMIDKVRAVHEFFDEDSDGFLNYWELRTMQMATESSADDLSTNQYQLVCEALDCAPNIGIDVESLRLTYASGGGSDVDHDFEIMIQLAKKIALRKREQAKAEVIAAEELQREKENKKQMEKVEEDVIDVIPGQGVDISPNT